MIFVTLGTHELPFNRLLDQLESLELTEEVLIQTGNTPHGSARYSCVPFLTPQQFEETMERCDLVITHAGAGSMLTALEKGKPTIAVPRLATYGEHNDDHQKELCEYLAQQNYLLTCTDMEDLGTAIEQSRHQQFAPYPFGNEKLLAAVKDAIDN